MKKSLSVIICGSLLLLLAACENLFPNNKQDNTSDSDINLQTKEFKITYFSSYENLELPEEKVVSENYELTQKDLPELSMPHYDFLGWKKGSQDSSNYIKPGFKVTTNLCLVPCFKEIKKARYKILYYSQNLEDDEYTLFGNPSEEDYPGNLTAAKVLKRPGFDPQPFDQKEIAADGSTVIEIYYNRKLITFSFETNGGTEISPITRKYGSKFNGNEISTTKDGYYISRWEPYFPQEFVEDKTFEAVWNTSSHTKFSVNYYRENPETGEYELYSTDYKKGITDTETEVIAKEYKGYEVQPFEQKIIEGDESTAINIYYNCITCTANFYDKDGNLLETHTGKYGAKIPEVIPPKIDFYNFNIWYGDYYSGEFNKEEANYKATYTPYPNASYTVNHHYQNIENDDYTVVSETKSYQIGRPTNAYTENDYGFTVKPYEQKIIEEDGSTVVDIYYDRKKFTFTFIDWSDKEPYKTVTQKYGSTLPEIEAPAADHYAFKFWSKDCVNSGSEIEVSKIIDGDRTYYASWKCLTIYYSAYHEYEVLNQYTENYMNKFTFKTEEDIIDFKENKCSGLELYPFMHFGGNYTILSGDIGEETKYEARTTKWEEHYDVIPFEQKIIQENETLDITIYYTLKRYTFTFIVNGKVYEEYTAKYGTSTHPDHFVPYVKDYEFLGWDSEIPETIDGDRTFTANLVPKIE